jgi:hypothetical protein
LKREEVIIVTTTITTIITIMGITIIMPGRVMGAMVMGLQVITDRDTNTGIFSITIIITTIAGIFIMVSRTIPLRMVPAIMV